MARWAKERRVFFIEEPLFETPSQESAPAAAPGGGRLILTPQAERLLVVTPALPNGLSDLEVISAQQRLLEQLIAECRIEDYLLWYYTPRALRYTRQLEPRQVIYDCMELSPRQGSTAAMRGVSKQHRSSPLRPGTRAAARAA
jgi:UDP-galactopyranose mutase